MRLAVAALAFAAITVLTVLVAQPRMFSGFASYDDEGYMLIALRSFLEHGHLYDDVFSQYGPFYYEFWGGFFEVFGIPVDHDGGRTAALVAWVGAALLFGLAIWRTTRSILLGIATQMLVFGAIITVVNEPMHPGGLICLLLGAIVALSCLVRGQSSPLAMAFLGGAVAALILVKINVGAFALIALALVAAVSYPQLARWRWLRPAVEVLFVALPVLLMASELGEEWARHYAVHVVAAALAVVIVLRAREARPREGEELWWFVGGLVAVGLTVCAALLAAGTTPGGLIEGVISQPLRQTDAFSIPLRLDDRTYLFDLLGLVGAASFWYFDRDRERAASPALISLAAVLSILVGLEMALSVIGKTALFNATAFTGYQFTFLPLAWVALIPFVGRDEEGPSFTWLLLPPLAVLQALHAFPVAGSQMGWSTFLLIPVGALCIAGGARGLVRVLATERERRAVGAVAVVAAAVTMIVLINVQLRQPLHNNRAAYDDALVSLGLPGAEDVHVTAEEADLYRQVTRAIDANCASLVTLPGLNSFYFWSELEPPTGHNATAWTTLFEEERQQRVIDATRSIPDLCLLENEGLALNWSPEGIPDGPLLRYLRQGFRPVATIGGYRLLRREGPGGSA